MFYIPAEYQTEMTFDQAADVIRNRAHGDLFRGMENVQAHWNHHNSQDDITDEEFFDVWIYELNAYNTVFEGLKKLFG